ncbi:MULTISPECIES: alanine racemase [Sphingomonas]|uniref:alanine racemase n=1 Tax=Sphingomonas TaxID=13687 RepID=UPI000DEFDAC3|nr:MULTISPECIES: alanine racemase [Sphingomonas]
MHFPLKLRCSRDALSANYRWLQGRTRASVGAAVKANGYGLGARDALETLANQGCRDFFVSTYSEAIELEPAAGSCSVMVLHGVGPDDLAAALASKARPVLNTAAQVARWKAAAPDRPCDLMVDTGMNRLGLRPEDLGVASGLALDTVHSHLACADEDHPLNERQRQRFAEIAASLPAKRHSLANSAGILLGPDFHFGLVRPGLALYGGIPRAEARGKINQVAFLQAEVIQRRLIKAGESCGYSATFVAKHDTPAAVINIGYADGYWRGFSSSGAASVGGERLPVLGRVSMDLVILDCSAAPLLSEGDWVDIDFELASAAEQSGMSQYELLTGLGDRFERSWF